MVTIQTERFLQLPTSPRFFQGLTAGLSPMFSIYRAANLPQVWASTDGLNGDKLHVLQKLFQPVADLWRKINQQAATLDVQRLG